MKPIYLSLSYAEAKLPVGASHFFGDPDMPAGVEYPTFVDDEGTECDYTFVCQINLAELHDAFPNAPLPSEGLLSVFADIDYYMGDFDYPSLIGGGIGNGAKALYFPDCGRLDTIKIVDSDNCPLSPSEMKIEFKDSVPPLCDEHALFAAPTHRPWQNWDSPYEDWIILLQIDSFSGKDFNLNFIDCGVLDILISPSDLKNNRFDNLKALVLST